MLHRATFLLLLGLLSLRLPAQQLPPVRLNTARLDSLLTSLAANRQMMGSLTLSQGGKTVYSRAFGAQQTGGAADVPATSATRYRVGSISKMFTAVMIFQLIDERKLTLSTPLSTFFPQLPNAATITVDQLLGHRSGLRSLTDEPAYGTYLTQPKTSAELLTIVAGLRPDFAPGARFGYSNTNYLVLGYLVEKLGRQPYAQALQTRIVARAGLQDTYYGGKIGSRPPEAFSYDYAGGGWQPSVETDMSIPGGAGAVVSTPTDLTRFLEALFAGKLVSKASLAAMQPPGIGYGRGLSLTPFDGRQGYGHGGAIDGFRGMASYFPAQQLAVALCLNGQRYPLNDALIGVLSIYFGRPYRLPDFTAPTFVPAPADLARYAGTYASPQLPALKITMTPAGPTLRSQATGQGAFDLEPVSAGVFQFPPAGIRVEFSPDQPRFTLRQGGGSYLFTKE